MGFFKTEKTEIELYIEENFKLNNKESYTFEVNSEWEEIKITKDEGKDANKPIDRTEYTSES